MKLLSAIIRPFIGLFVDDEFLALAILAVVGLTALMVKVAGVEPLVAAAVLLGGCLVVLVLGVLRTARSR
jgi:hypothetical protein